MKANALKVRRGEPRVRWLTRGEEEAVLALLDTWIAAGSADHAGRLTLKRAVIIAIDTGLRLAELCNMRWPDISFERGNVRVRKEVAKSKKDRWVPLLPRSLALLKQMQEETASEWIFPALGGKGPRSNFDKALRHFAGTAIIRRQGRANQFAGGPVIKAGLDPFSWHDLRRTCGCRLLQEHGLSMEEVSKWLGHKSISVTERHYAFLTVDNLHKALEKGRARDTKNSTPGVKRVKRKRWVRR
jgi:integrase